MLQSMQEGSPYPVASVPYTAASQLYTAHLVSAKKITADDAAKCTLQLSFRVEVRICHECMYVYKCLRVCPQSY